VVVVVVVELEEEVERQPHHPHPRVSSSYFPLGQLLFLLLLLVHFLLMIQDTK